MIHKLDRRRFGVGKLVTGTRLNCSNWGAEAALRMLHHNVHPDVAERSADLVVYGGTGKAARNQECWDAIALALLNLEPDETLIVQSGKPVHVLRTMPGAPRVIIANSNLVGRWANWEHFRELEREGLMMYGQMTAGSWIYIGTQGILQGTYETFAAALRKHFDGEGRGRLIVSGGLGGMGGAQPMAATMTGAVFLAAEVDPARLEKRLATKYLDERAPNIDAAIDRALAAKAAGEAVSIGVVANQVDLLKALIARNVVPDLLTDQTSAHDDLNGYVPDGMSFEAAVALRTSDAAAYIAASKRTMVDHCRLMVQLARFGAHTFDYGNNLRGQAKAAGYLEAFEFPGFVPAYIRPLFCEGKGPFRWVALSGDPQDIRATDRAILRLFPQDKALARWIEMAGRRVKFQGLPCRICWLGLGERDIAGLEFNRMVARGELSAPVIIGRDHLDCGSVASPNRETEGMLDGTDAVADWVFINVIMNAIGGATWVSVHEGGGVGIGYSQHAGQVILCDGSRRQAAALKRVLWYDPASGVARHADAGYPDAIAVARKHRLKIPMLPKPPRRGR